MQRARKWPGSLALATGQSFPLYCVQVCAPSNSALDEIVMRLLAVGLRGSDGAMYKPTVVRVGVHVHHSVAHVSLDKLVDERLAATANKVRLGLGRYHTQGATPYDTIIGNTV